MIIYMRPFYYIALSSRTVVTTEKQSSEIYKSNKDGARNKIEETLFNDKQSH